MEITRLDPPKHLEGLSKTPTQIFYIPKSDRLQPPKVYPCQRKTSPTMDQCIEIRRVAFANQENDMEENCKNALSIRENIKDDEQSQWKLGETCTELERIPSKPCMSWKQENRKDEQKLLQLALKRNRYLGKQPEVFPPHSLIVRWRQYHSVPGYTPQTIHVILSRYGEVAFVGSVSTNSVLVIFDKIQTANRLMQNQIVGFHDAPLIIDWLFPYMKGYEVREVIARSKESRHQMIVDSDEVKFTKQWQRMLKRAQNAMRKWGTQMNYDRSTFIP